VCGGQDASAEQVRSGYAWAYTRYLTDVSIAESAGRAREARRGLWRASKPINPSDWRKGRR
jgi:micrococcal nuclease